jgi:hypothetical protein
MTVKTIRSAFVGLFVVALASLAVGMAGAGVAQTQLATGCPAGFDRLSVTALEARGPYALPRQIDEAGNDNGYVCGRAQPASVRDAFCRQGAVVACLLEELGLPHYLFKDDDNPASDSAAADG